MDMGTNRDHYLNGVGDRYFLRRQGVMDRLAERWAEDPIVNAIDHLGLSGLYFEIGCSNGWRLTALERERNIISFGIDPSQKAIAEADVGAVVGTAENLNIIESVFDIVAFGFVLYACDTSSLFLIAHEANRVLRDGGHLIVYDFDSPDIVYRPNPDCAEIMTCKMDYGKMFSWHPHYKEVYRKSQKGPEDEGHSLNHLTTVFKKQKGY